MQRQRIARSQELRSSVGFEVLEERRMLAAVTPELIKDINAGGASSGPRDITEFHGEAYFIAGDPEHYTEVWKSDGTADGTRRVTNITTPGYDYPYVSSLIRSGNSLYFAVSDAERTQLWKTDGSEEGEEFVSDLPRGAYGNPPRFFYDFNGQLVFFVGETKDDRAIWISDGTTLGTRKVASLGFEFRGDSFLNHGDTFTFMDRTLEDYDPKRWTFRIWQSDGTTEGTYITGKVGEDWTYYPTEMVESEGELYFTVTASNGRSFWKSDGSAAGTIPLPGVVPTNSEVRGVTNVNGSLYYVVNRTLLWKWDGEEGAPQIVWNGIMTDPGYSSLHGIGDTLYFWMSDEAHGREMWKSDGGGMPSLVKDINPSFPSSGDSDLFSPRISMASVGGAVFFAPSTWTEGTELWTTDGTSDGTRLVKDINTLGTPWSDSAPQDFIAVGKLTYFTATDHLHGRELWRTDGTAAGTFRIGDFTPGNRDTLSFRMVAGEGLLYFTFGWSEMWRTDGTEAGTFLIDRGAGGLVSVGGNVFFTKRSIGSSEAYELWKTDGTVEGTQLVRGGLLPDQGYNPYYGPNNFGTVAGKLFFTMASSSGSGDRHEIWVSDGTRTGTLRIKVIEGYRATFSGVPQTIGDRLFFGIVDSSNRRHLWVTDGTTDGTREITSLTGVTQFDGVWYTQLDNYFTRLDANLENPVKLFNGVVRDAVTINGKLFFSGSSPSWSNDYKLWVSDGTLAGTVLLKDSAGKAIAGRSLKNLNGTLMFETDDGLWLSDGTATGTSRILYAVPFSLTNYLYSDGRLIGAGNNGVNGRELWKIWDAIPAAATADLNGSAEGNFLSTVYGATPIAIADPAATIVTTESQLAGLKVTMQIPRASYHLMADTAGTAIAATFAGGVLQLSGHDSVEHYEQVLRSVRFSASSDSQLPASLKLLVQPLVEGGCLGVPSETTIAIPERIVGRHLFYNDSKFDNYHSEVDAADDLAKSWLTPYFPNGNPSRASSVSSYIHGINGIMVDISGSLGQLSIADFDFRVGTNGAPGGTWADAPAPAEFVVRPGAGVNGSHRIVVTWPNGAIANTWLQVVVRGNDALGEYNLNTGLGASDIFYWGNRVGDTESEFGKPYTTNSSDAAGVFRYLSADVTVVTSRYDLNRDGRIDSADAAIVFANLGSLPQLQLSLDAVLEGVLATDRNEAATGTSDAIRVRAAKKLRMGVVGSDTSPLFETRPTPTNTSPDAEGPSGAVELRARNAAEYIALSSVAGEWASPNEVDVDLIVLLARVGGIQKLGKRSPSPLLTA